MPSTKLLIKSLFPFLALGAFLGHLDLLARILALNFEWFEIYLSLLVPTVAGAAIGILLTPLTMFLNKRYSNFIPTLACSLAILALLEYIISYAFDDEITQVVFLLMLVPVVFVVDDLYRFFSGKRSVAYGLGSLLVGPRLAKVGRDYIFSIMVFCLVSAGVDIYNLRFANAANFPSVEPEGRPNVILITLDTLRARSLSSYGYARKTSPNIEALAQQGVLFERALSTSPWTLPAHASIFTGKKVSSHGASLRAQKLGESELTLAEILKGVNYYNIGFVGGPYAKAKYGLGQGFHSYHDRLDFFEWANTSERFSIRAWLAVIARPLHDLIFRADGERNSKEINQDIFRFLDDYADRKEGKPPFFLFINYFDVHDPYNLGEEFREQFTNERRNDPELMKWLHELAYSKKHRYEKKSVPEDLRQYLIDLYDSEIMYLDRSLGELIARLTKLELLGDTIIAITSDHGEEFFEHGGVLHAYTLYDEVIHVPMIISYPSRFTPKRIDTQVSIQDLFPTILELAGAELPENIDARSLVKLMEDGSWGEVRPVYSELLGREEQGEITLRAASLTPWKYIEADREAPRIGSSLFNLESDPKESNNLIEKLPEKVTLLQDLLK